MRSYDTSQHLSLTLFMALFGSSGALRDSDLSWTPESADNLSDGVTEAVDEYI